MLFRIISTLVISNLCFVQGQQQSCKTPSGGSGNCMSLYDCSSLMAIMNKPQKSQEDINTLRSSACGFQGSTPKVCCPIAAPPRPNFCFTPDAQEGQCGNLYSCSYLTRLLSKPNEDIIAFVQSSKCEGSEQYSVCCGSKPPNLNPPRNKVCTTSTVAPPDLRSACCGRDAANGDRIIGGADADIDQYPWMALIEYSKDNQIKLLCGGSLISGRYVLTAGHCVVGRVLNSGTPVNVRLGEYDISNEPEKKDCVIVNGGGEDCTPGAVVIPIENIKVHEEYNPNQTPSRHDIALLRLTKLAPFTEFIRPICLPQKDITLTNSPKIKLYVAGWGRVNETHSKSLIKQYVGMPYVNNNECQPSYNVKGRKAALWKGQLCAGGEADKDSCNGDSGGPLMHDNNDTFEIIGVVSFGPTPCGMKNVPGVYTKVIEYQAWIRKNILP